MSDDGVFPVPAPRRGEQRRVPKRALAILVPLGAIFFALSWQANAARGRAEVRAIGTNLLALHQTRATEVTRSALAYARTSDPVHLDGLREAARWAASSLRVAREGWGARDAAVDAELERLEQLWDRHYLEAQAVVTTVAAGDRAAESIAALERSAQILEVAGQRVSSPPPTGGGPPWLPGVLAAVGFLLAAASWIEAGEGAEAGATRRRSGRYGRQLPQPQ